MTFNYDALNRATTMVDAVGTTAYTYSQVGQLLSEDGPWTDDTVSLGYKNRLRSSLGILNPVGTSWTQTYGYDASERLTSVTSPAGVFGYQYDTTRNTRIATLALPGGSSISNNFDSVARLTGTYLKNSSGAITNSHVYTINLGGQRTVQTRVDGSFVGYRYDNEGELISARGYESGGMTSRTNEFFGYVYDDENQLIRVTTGSTAKSEFVYDGRLRRRITRDFVWGSVGGAVSSMVTNVVLSTTVRSNLTGWAGLRFAVGSSPVVVTALGRWVVSGNSGSHALKLVRSDGNDVPGATATVNLSGISTNQFSYASLSTPVVLEANTTYFLVSQEVTNGDKWYDYNSTLTPSSGFTINGTVWALNGTTSYTVIAGTNSGYIPVNLKFTAGGWNLAGETRYIYGGMTVVQERDQNNVPLVTYTRGQDLSGSLQGAGGIGGLLARTDQTASTPTHAYYHADGNGNITAMISYQQNLVARYLYDPFGNTLSKSGPLADANTYRFSSKEWHAGSMLYSYGYRFYSPGLQRWLNRDPIGEEGGINLYVLAGNSPVFHWDVLGLDTDWGKYESSKGNCWRHACNDPKKDNEPHSRNPPGWRDVRKCDDLIKSIKDSKAGEDVPSTGKCPEGSNKVAVYYSEDANSRAVDPRDYHFTRQNPDGTWCDKSGYYPEERYPKEPTPLYTYKRCGYLCIKNGYDTDSGATGPK